MSFNRSGFGRTLLLRKNDETVRDIRKLLHGELSARSIKKYMTLQEVAARDLCRSNLQNPIDFRRNIRRLVDSHMTTAEVVLTELAEWQHQSYSELPTGIL